MYSEDLYYPIIDSISELLKVMIKILTDAVKSVRDSDKCKIQTNRTTVKLDSESLDFYFDKPERMKFTRRGFEFMLAS